MSWSRRRLAAVLIYRLRTIRLISWLLSKPGRAASQDSICVCCKATRNQVNDLEILGNQRNTTKQPAAMFEMCRDMSTSVTSVLYLPYRAQEVFSMDLYESHKWTCCSWRGYCPFVPPVTTLMNLISHCVFSYTNKYCLWLVEFSMKVIEKIRAHDVWGADNQSRYCSGTLELRSANTIAYQLMLIKADIKVWDDFPTEDA